MHGVCTGQAVLHPPEGIVACKELLKSKQGAAIEAVAQRELVQCDSVMVDRQGRIPLLLHNVCRRHPFHAAPLITAHQGAHGGLARQWRRHCHNADNGCSFQLAGHGCFVARQLTALLGVVALSVNRPLLAGH